VVANRQDVERQLGQQVVGYVGAVLGGGDQTRSIMVISRISVGRKERERSAC
jgi:hypothetical protein